MSDDVPPSEVRRTAAMTVLTVTAGAVDAVSFLTPGKVFRALVTGNVQFPSFAPAGAGDAPVARAAAAFATGAAAGGLTLTALDARGRPWFVAGPAGEGLLIAAGSVALGRHGLAKVVDHTDYGVALAVGLRASTAPRMHVPGAPALLSRTALAESVDDLLHRPLTVTGAAPPAGPLPVGGDGAGHLRRRRAGHLAAGACGPGTRADGDRRGGAPVRRRVPCRAAAAGGHGREGLRAPRLVQAGAPRASYWFVHPAQSAHVPKISTVWATFT